MASFDNMFKEISPLGKKLIICMEYIKITTFLSTPKKYYIDFEVNLC